MRSISLSPSAILVLGHTVESLIFESDILRTAPPEPSSLRVGYPELRAEVVWGAFVHHRGFHPLSSIYTEARIIRLL